MGAVGFQNTSWNCKGRHLPISELALFRAESLVAVCTLFNKPRSRANLQTDLEDHIARFVIALPHSIAARPCFATIEVVFVLGTTALFRYHQRRNSDTKNCTHSIRARGGTYAETSSGRRNATAMVERIAAR